MQRTKSEQLFDQAQKYIPGGVNSPARAFGAVGGDPLFIARGEELVYVVLDRPEQLRLMRLNLVDRTVHPLHKDEMRSELEPAFSSDGRYYVFLQNRGAASVAMVIRDLQTNEYAEIPPAPGFAGMRSPAFSPDAKRLIYSFAEHGRQQIYSVNTKGKDPKTLIDSTGINNWQSYSVTNL